MYVGPTDNNYRPQRSLGKVMFLHVSVILFTRGGGGISAYIAGGIPACLAAGLAYLAAGLRGRGVSRPTPGGCIPVCTEADTPPPWTATAASATHPTGMHSCYIL